MLCLQIKNYKNGDCTHFVSQALSAGSMPYFKEWTLYKCMD
ncbi:amidase domain-containing protein [Bacillus mojavensis]